MACVWAKIGPVVYGAERGQVHESYFAARPIDITDLIKDAFRDDLTVRAGVLSEQCAALYVGPNEGVPREEIVNL